MTPHPRRPGLRRGLAALLAGALAATSCAGLRVRPAPTDPEALLTHDCKRPRSAIVGDAILLGGSLVVLVLGASNALSPGDDPLDDELAGGVWATPAGVAALSAGSLFLAARRINACGRAQARVRAEQLGGVAPDPEPAPDRRP